MSGSSQSLPKVEDIVSQLQAILSNVPSNLLPFVLEAILKKQDKAMSEACAVSLLNQTGTTMFGRRIKNPYQNPDPKADPKARKEYHIHPYSKQGSGSSVTIAYTDPETLEIYVLLARKKNDTGQYEQVGGYTKGHWPEGGEAIVDSRSDDKKDSDEETMIGNKNAVKFSSSTTAAPQANYTLDTIKPSIRETYSVMLRETAVPLADFQIDPTAMKAQLLKRGFVMNTQFNAEETALDEVLQETNLDLRRLGRRPVRVKCTDDFGISNESEKLHTVVNHFVVDLGMRSDAPAHVKAGSDIGELSWVPVSKIILSDSKNDFRSTYLGKPIRLDYGTVTLSACIKEMRCCLIQGQSRKRFLTPETVEFALMDALQDWVPSKASRFQVMRSLLGNPPRAEVGIEAHLYHLRILKVNQFLQASTTLTAGRLTDLKTELENEMQSAQVQAEAKKEFKI